MKIFRRSNALLVVCSSVISILFVEFVILEFYLTGDSGGAEWIELNHEEAIREKGFDRRLNETNYASIIEEVYDITPHPYRWYVGGRNLDNEYTYSDELGYRIKKESVKNNTVTVGIFGGSTTYSVLTIPEYAIPQLIQTFCGNKLQILNFGFGGYSSSAELGAVIEATRHYSLDHAIFYDGVNEIGRYMEYYQWSRGLDVMYSKIGFPYDPLGWKSINYRAAWQENIQWLELSNIGNMFYRGIYALSDNSAYLINHSELDLLEDIPGHSKNILSIYQSNVELLEDLSNARNFYRTTEFFWQPSMAFKRRNKREHSMDEVGKRLHEETRENIRKEMPNVIDISGAFEENDKLLFLDDVHGGRTLNELVSRIIIDRSTFLNRRCTTTD